MTGSSVQIAAYAQAYFLVLLPTSSSWCIHVALPDHSSGIGYLSGWYARTSWHDHWQLSKGFPADAAILADPLARRAWRYDCCGAIEINTLLIDGQRVGA